MSEVFALSILTYGASKSMTARDMVLDGERELSSLRQQTEFEGPTCLQLILVNFLKNWKKMQVCC